MFIVLFGTPGVGKSFIGNILKNEYDFYFYDADIDLTPDMKLAVQKQELYTDTMRDSFFQIVIEQVHKFKQQYQKLVMAQALVKERNRLQILKAFPEAQFFHIATEPEIIKERLAIRHDWVTQKYAQMVRNIFEAPQLPHQKIDNNDDKTHVQMQLNGLL